MGGTSGIGVGATGAKVVSAGAIRALDQVRRRAGAGAGVALESLFFLGLLKRNMRDGGQVLEVGTLLKKPLRSHGGLDGIADGM